MTDFLNALKKYAVFRGRARRREYWMFVLWYSLLSLPFIILDVMLAAQNGGKGEPALVLTSLYSLAMLLPSLAVNIRRLHDVGRSGWWYLLGLVPLAGPIALFVFHIEDSQPDSNKWGPSPKAFSPNPALVR